MAATATPCSWAQIVNAKAMSEDTTNKAVKPGARGSLLRLCRGKVLTLLSHYGWLMMMGCVDHPATGKHDGDVYFHKDDVVDGEDVRPGDIVEFFLYADEKGLGAEECRVVERSPDGSDVESDEFFATDDLWQHKHKFTMRANAEEFVPMGSFNTSEEEIEEDNPNLVPEVEDVLQRLTRVFAAETAEDSDDETDWLALDIKKHHGAPSSDGSTLALSSDSEEDFSSGCSSDSEDEDLEAAETRIFPLDVVAVFGFPPGFQAPPGLILPPPGIDLP